MVTAKWFTSSVVTLLALSAIGCGQGYKSGGSSDTSSKQSGGGTPAVDVSEQMQKVEQASGEADLAMAQAQAEMNKLIDSKGNFKISVLFKGSSDTSTTGIAKPLADKLKPILDQVLEKVTLVKSKFDVVRLALAAAIAKLDPTVPSQAAMIATLQEQLARVDALETKFTDGIHKLAMKLDVVMDALDKAVDMVTRFIPFPLLGIVADVLIDWLVLDDFKVLIQAFQARLLAL